MLLFIGYRNTLGRQNKIISIHLMLLFIRKIEFIPIGFKHFNTSHVTVYRSTIYINVTIYTDFNTSHVTVYHHKLLPFCPIFSFQYISCYCLSVQVYAVLFPFFYFNTSHVTVYQTPMRLKRLKVRYFNTSHVTVYPISINVQALSNVISIHLMLLFIHLTITL